MYIGGRKATTGLVGMLVAGKPKDQLILFLERITRHLQKIPDSSPYKARTEEFVSERMALAKSVTKIEVFEDKYGQTEEVLFELREELLNCRKMVEYKVWEPLEEVPLPDQRKWPM